jgi:hypothetical protein
MKKVTNIYTQVKALRTEVKRLKLKCQDIDDSELVAKKREEKLNSPSFAGARKNMNEFSGCMMACKAIRQSMDNLSKDYVDSEFTGRLTHLITKIRNNDTVGEKGKRAIAFSKCKPLFSSLKMNKRQILDLSSMIYFNKISHSASRNDACLRISDFWIKSGNIPSGATCFRMLSHLSLISDYHFSDHSGKYEPDNILNGLNVVSYSPFIDIYDKVNVEIKTAFPEGTVVDDNCTVLHFVGLAFYMPNGQTGYIPLFGRNSLMLCDVF